MENKFTVNENTKIGFGKLKGQPHSVLFQKHNENYKRWIVNQGPEFRYKNTRDWLVSFQDEDENGRSVLKVFTRSCDLDEQNEEFFHKFKLFMEEYQDDFGYVEL